jgi:hypothetical protein
VTPHFFILFINHTLRKGDGKFVMTNSVPPKLNPQKDPHQTAIVYLRICVDTALIPRFLKLLERGFNVKIAASLSIRELLCNYFGISEEYVDNRIQTIFLDGRPVDNVDTAWIENGSKLALSAAMPGLVGATFRKGGRYASFRETISYSRSKKAVAGGDGEITLKFFNMIAKELGPAFLQKGIIIEGIHFRDFAVHNLEDLKAGCHSIHLNDEKTDVAGLLQMSWENDQVFLQVTPA